MKVHETLYQRARRILHNEILRRVTGRITDALESGAILWRKAWVEECRQLRTERTACRDRLRSDGEFRSDSENHDKYLARWVKALRQDYSLIFRVDEAASAGRITFRLSVRSSNTLETAMIPINQPKFTLGRLASTPGALEALQESGQTPWCFLSRHVAADWGEVCVEDWRLNDEALRDGSRLLSAYRTLKGKKLWIITEADRSLTTLQLPEEY